MTQKARNKVDPDLEATLGRLRACRKRDPSFERAIADYVEAEASLEEDPAEGQKVASIQLPDPKGAGERPC